MMTKRDFEDLASAATIVPLCEGRVYMARVMAEVCARHNPKFDRYRFMIACGLPSEAGEAKP